jgi:hypothetical protein
VLAQWRQPGKKSTDGDASSSCAATVIASWFWPV